MQIKEGIKGVHNMKFDINAAGYSGSVRKVNDGIVYIGARSRCQKQTVEE